MKSLDQIGLNTRNIFFTVIIELLLLWNKSLTTQVDKEGSTPLHFVQFSSKSTQTLEKVFKANPAALYQADNNGFFAIHVAASVGATDAVRFFPSGVPG
jgi:ankyrin repeat protein